MVSVVISPFLHDRCCSIESQASNISLHLSFDSCVASGETVNIVCSANESRLPTVQILNFHAVVLAEGTNGMPASVSLVANETTSGIYSCILAGACGTKERRFTVCTGKFIN